VFDLSVKIISRIFSEDYGAAWKRVMTDREYSFSDRAQSDYNAPKALRYSVGQPMGALSS